MIIMKKTLLDFCEIIVDCEHKTAPIQTIGYASIRTPNVGRGRLLLDGVNRVDEATYREWTKRAIPQEKDLIIAREAPVGNVAIIKEGQVVCLGQRTVLVRPDPKKIIPDFLCYFLLGDYTQNIFQGASSGATVKHLNMKDIRAFSMPELPSISTQRRIASIQRTTHAALRFWKKWLGGCMRNGSSIFAFRGMRQSALWKRSLGQCRRGGRSERLALLLQSIQRP